MKLILKLIDNDDSRATNKYCSSYLISISRSLRTLTGHNLKIKYDVSYSSKPLKHNSHSVGTKVLLSLNKFNISGPINIQNKQGQRVTVEALQLRVFRLNHLNDLCHPRVKT